MAIAFSHAGSGQTAGATSVSASVTVNPGDCVIVVVVSSTTAYKVSDDANNAYFAVRGGGTPSTTYYACSSATSAATTVTTTNVNNISQAVSLSVATYTGVGNVGGFTQTNANSTSVSQTVQIDDTGDVAVFVAGVNSGAAVTATVTAGTQRTNQAASTTMFGSFIADTTATVPGPLTGTATLSSAVFWATEGVQLRTFNSYSNNPLVLSGNDNGSSYIWRTGTVTTPTTHSFGIRPQKVIWTNRPKNQTNTFSLTDPNTGAIYLQGTSIDGANPQDIQYSFRRRSPPCWHNFRPNFTPQASAGTLLIFYNNKV